MKIGIVLALYCCAFGAMAQSLSFLPQWSGAPLVLGENYYSPQLPDSVRIEALRFYVSDVQLLKNGRIISVLPQKYWLIDLEQPASLQINLDTAGSFDTIQFSIGIDSTTNVSGAMDGDLDPTKGMYWTWQSGYINFKLEGYSAFCPTRNHFFQWHIGGYQSPFNTVQNLQFPANKSVEIQLSVQKIVEFMYAQRHYEVMSPSAKAVVLAHVIAQSFTAQDE